MAKFTFKEAAKKARAVRSNAVKGGRSTTKSNNGLIKSTKKLRDSQREVKKLVSVQVKPSIKEKKIRIFAETTAITEGYSKYNQVIIYDNVNFSDTKSEKFKIPVKLANGKKKYAEVPNSSTHPTKNRCSCLDFKFTWNYYDKTKEVLHGRPMPPPPGQPIRNPKKVPGLCKHLLQLVNYLYSKKIIK